MSNVYRECNFFNVIEYSSSVRIYDRVDLWLRYLTTTSSPSTISEIPKSSIPIIPLVPQKVQVLLKNACR